jgi:hypothetical protein
MLMRFLMKRSSPALETLDARIPPEVSLFLKRTGVLSLRQALPRVATEFGRARRHARAVSLAVFSEGPPPAPPSSGSGTGIAPAAAPEPDAPRSPGLEPAVLASVLREVTRDTDIVIYATALRRSLVVMPETSAAAAQQAVGRLQALCARRLHGTMCAGLAVFPDDGWTFEELVRQAEHNASRGVTASADVTGAATPATVSV